MLWGYIGERYLADFMPFVIVASGIGLIDVWRRFEGRSRKARGQRPGHHLCCCRLLRRGQFGHCDVSLGAVHAVEVQDFVSTEQSLSLTSLADTVQHGTTLPNWAPYGQLFMVGNCSGLYMASGIDEKNVPGLLIDHYTWIPVEQNPAFTRDDLRSPSIIRGSTSPNR